MYSLRSGKHKDANPIESIAKAREVLCKLGIFVKENWCDKLNGLYSVCLISPETNIHSNGKGTSYEYALASAYGELMEELGNGVAYRFGVTMSEDDIKFGGFVYSPDELCFEKNSEAKAEFINMYKDIIGKCKFEDFYDFLLSVSKSGTTVPAVPFYSLDTSKCVYLPPAMTDCLYGTNGMAAGNSQYEALVHALSEIIERHVNIRILTENIVPPSIPREYFSKFPALEELINAVAKSGYYDIVIKDCSLGEGWPVLALVLSDKKTSKYFIKFASHPTFEITVERLFTELMQGKNLDKMVGMQELCFDAEVIKSRRNIEKNIRNGKGMYPISLFNELPTYEFCEFEYVPVVDTKEANKLFFFHIFEKFQRLNKKILVRDTSFLGFHSYQVIIPGFSEIVIDSDWVLKKKGLPIDPNELNFRNFGAMSNNELRQAIEYFDYVKFGGINTLADLFKMAFSSKFPWKKIKASYLKACIYYKLGELKNACKELEAFILMLEKSNEHPDTIAYFKASLCYIRAKDNQINRLDKLIEMMFPPNIAREVCNDLADSSKSLSYIGKISCFDCENCDFRALCNYEHISKLHKRLKHLNSENIIDQTSLANLLQ